MARMAWFKKERKPRTSERVKLEIPADAWEKCDRCGHIDIRSRLLRSSYGWPHSGAHRRIPASAVTDVRAYAGSWHDVEATRPSTSPLGSGTYRERVALE